MARQWELETPSGRCARTGRALQEGEEFLTVLFEEGESFRRVDCSLDAWDGPPESCYCYFRTRVPIKQKRKKLLIEDDLLVNFFARLADETEPVRVHFRFVLALILMRKRRLRYEGSATEDGSEVWRMVLATDKSVHRVVNPRLTDEQIQQVSEQLGEILHSDMGGWTEQAEGGDAADTSGPQA